MSDSRAQSLSCSPGCLPRSKPMARLLNDKKCHTHPPEIESRGTMFFCDQNASLIKAKFRYLFPAGLGSHDPHTKHLRKACESPPAPSLTAVGLCNRNMYYRNESSEIHFPQVLPLHVYSCNTHYSPCRVTPPGPQNELPSTERFPGGASLQRQPAQVEVQLFRILTH